MLTLKELRICKNNYFCRMSTEYMVLFYFIYLHLSEKTEPKYFWWVTIHFIFYLIVTVYVMSLKLNNNSKVGLKLFIE